MVDLRFICPDTDSPCEFKYCDSTSRCLFQECKVISDIPTEIADSFTKDNAKIPNIFGSYSFSREQEYWKFLLTPTGHVIHFDKKVLIRLPKTVTSPATKGSAIFKDIFSSLTEIFGLEVEKASSYDNNRISTILGEDYQKYGDFTYSDKSFRKRRYLRKVLLPKDLASRIDRDVCEYHNDIIFLLYICKYLSSKYFYSSAWKNLILSSRAYFLYHDLALFIIYKQQALYFSLYILTYLAKNSDKFLSTSLDTQAARGLALSLIDFAPSLPDVGTEERYNLFNFDFDLSDDLRSLKSLKKIA